MTKRHQLSAISAILLILVSLPVFAGEPSTLGYKFRDGDTLRYRLTMDNRMKISGFPVSPKQGTHTFSPQQVNQTLELEMTYRVLKVNPDRSAEVEISLGKAALKMTSGNTVLLDSDDPQGSLGSDFLSSLEGTTISITVLPTGKIEKVTGLQTLDDQFQGFDFSGVLQQLQGFFPEHQIRPGDKWTREGTTQLPLLPGLETVIAQKSRYQFLQVETFRAHPCAKIKVQGDYRLKTESDVGGNSSANASFAGRGSGLIYFDLERGVPRSSDFNSQISAKFPISSEGSKKTTMSIEMKMRLVMELRQ